MEVLTIYYQNNLEILKYKTLSIYNLESQNSRYKIMKRYIDIKKHKNNIRI